MTIAPDLFTPRNDTERMADRLREHGVEVEWTKLGAAYVRDVIERAGLAEVIVWRGKDGRPATYRDAFRHVFSEAL